MTAAQGVAQARAEQSWQLRAVAVRARLGGGDVIVTGDDALGPWRIVHAATGAPYVAALSSEERSEVRGAMARALMVATRKAG